MHLCFLFYAFFAHDAIMEPKDFSIQSAFRFAYVLG